MVLYSYLKSIFAQLTQIQLHVQSQSRGATLDLFKVRKATHTHTEKDNWKGR
jgi:hypothetical protein